MGRPKSKRSEISAKLHDRIKQTPTDFALWFWETCKRIETAEMLTGEDLAQEVVSWYSWNVGDRGIAVEIESRRVRFVRLIASGFHAAANDNDQRASDVLLREALNRIGVGGHAFRAFFDAVEAHRDRYTPEHAMRWPAVKQWFAERVCFTKGESVTGDDLYKSYVDWIRVRGGVQVSQKELTKAVLEKLHARGLERAHTHYGKRYQGIALKR